MSVSKDFQDNLSEPTATLEIGGIRRFVQFAGGFWRGRSSARAWTLTAFLGLGLLLSTGASVALNQWTRWFFDALEARDTATMPRLVVAFAVIVVAMAAIGVLIVLCRETLQVRWRGWLMERILASWLAENRYLRLQVTHNEPESPEYRVADDSRWATEMLVDLAIGLVLAVLGSIAFIGILWKVGGSITVPMGDVSIVIPAYMVLVALAYGALATWLTVLIGRPLVGRVAARNASEGAFRFGMMRMREHTEQVALMHGAKGERAILGRLLDRVVGRWLAVVRLHGRLTIVTNSVGPMTPVIPLLFAAPKYLSGTLSLGEVTQIAGAFIAVQLSVSWVVDNYNRTAEWYASARRIMELVDACDELGAARPIPHRAPREGLIELDAVLLKDAEGRPVIADATLTAHAGEHISIVGNSNSGKTALVWIISDLLAPTQGEVRLMPSTRIMIVPQRSYLPGASLADFLAYPNGRETLDTEQAAEALEYFDLGSHKVRLFSEGRWDRDLAQGERQRLIMAHVLIQKPDILVLDDPFPAIDDDAERFFFNALRQRLPKTLLLRFDQGPSQTGFDRAFEMIRIRAGGVILQEQPQKREPVRTRVDKNDPSNRLKLAK